MILTLAVATITVIIPSLTRMIVDPTDKRYFMPVTPCQPSLDLIGLYEADEDVRKLNHAAWIAYSSSQSNRRGPAQTVPVKGKFFEAFNARFGSGDSILDQVKLIVPGYDSVIQSIFKEPNLLDKIPFDCYRRIIHPPPDHLNPPQAVGTPESVLQVTCDDYGGDCFLDSKNPQSWFQLSINESGSELTIVKGNGNTEMCTFGNANLDTNQTIKTWRGPCRRTRYSPGF